MHDDRDTVTFSDLAPLASDRGDVCALLPAPPEAGEADRADLGGDRADAWRRCVQSLRVRKARAKR